MCTKRSNKLFTMALVYLVIALAIQGSITYADENNEQAIDSQQTLIPPPIDEEAVKDFQKERQDWIDYFLLPPLYPTSAVAKMTEATDSEKSMEEQLEDMKAVAQKLTLMLQSEMAKLLAYAMSVYENKEEEEICENGLRDKRSIDTPMASTELITRLLKHIKSNNEYQNIAIDKMMTAQEIADKYGIEFSPDTEIISDLAFAANQQAKEMTALLQDTLEMKNSTKRAATQPQTDEKEETCYVYAQPAQTQPAAPQHQPGHHHHHADAHPTYYYPYETQIPAPVPNYYNPPVTPRPNFCDAVSYSPDYYSQCTIEPLTTTIILPFEEIEPEPELVGEEFEETVSSKVYVERGEEPGSASVNHVMTYTVAEKSHFRTPEIERLPQQMQYCFFLM